MSETMRREVEDLAVIHGGGYGEATTASAVT